MPGKKRSIETDSPLGSPGEGTTDDQAEGEGEWVDGEVDGGIGESRKKQRMSNEVEEEEGGAGGLTLPQAQLEEGGSDFHEKVEHSVGVEEAETEESLPKVKPPRLCAKDEEALRQMQLLYDGTLSPSAKENGKGEGVEEGRARVFPLSSSEEKDKHEKRLRSSVNDENGEEKRGSRRERRWASASSSSASALPAVRCKEEDEEEEEDFNEEDASPQPSPSPSDDGDVEDEQEEEEEGGQEREAEEDGGPPANYYPGVKLPLGETGRCELKMLIGEKCRRNSNIQAKIQSIAKLKCATNEQLILMANICGLWETAVAISEKFKRELERRALTGRGRSRKRRATPIFRKGSTALNNAYKRHFANDDGEQRTSVRASASARASASSAAPSGSGRRSLRNRSSTHGEPSPRASGSSSAAAPATLSLRRTSRRRSSPAVSEPSEPSEEEEENPDENGEVHGMGAIPVRTGRAGEDDLILSRHPHAHDVAGEDLLLHPHHAYLQHSHERAAGGSEHPGTVHTYAYPYPYPYPYPYAAPIISTAPPTAIHAAPGTALHAAPTTALQTAPTATALQTVPTTTSLQTVPATSLHSATTTSLQTAPASSVHGSPSTTLHTAAPSTSTTTTTTLHTAPPATHQVAYYTHPTTHQTLYYPPPSPYYAHPAPYHVSYYPAPPMTASPGTHPHYAHPSPYHAHVIPSPLPLPAAVPGQDPQLHSHSALADLDAYEENGDELDPDEGGGGGAKVTIL
uniref:Uncharacterized protein n=1 Tax=Chromera velia CCMP2878 TaxID=1169474 RepID=A0A0G4HNL1_9ALVE|eukprot:Cvel_7622.t1-p1 / transcript=Cvel_7622.t1 / gene=Cvel_7622 / organism=Chromera_velia_CCMP2878 / gene_product=hypothetical protein / transcript_product=hypothetical protein / location=Cvel_scaffold402:35225-38729(+) / protein_length=742 / sequence_SO=supercontig / SO=protein_coding / is_pseudo=false